MEEKHLKRFIKYFLYLKDSGNIISGYFPEINKEKKIQEIADVMEHFKENGRGLLNTSLGKIKHNLFRIDANDREAYLRSFLKLFIPYAPYLNFEKGIETIDKPQTPSLKIPYDRRIRMIRNCHTLIIQYKTKNIKHFNDLSIAQQYIIDCYRSYRYFFHNLSSICIDLNIDITNNQYKNVVPEEYFSVHKVKFLTPQPKTESQFSVLEWATIFYYADETKLLTDDRLIKTRMEQFMSKHQINTSPANFKKSYYEAKRRINNKHDYPINKLKLIIPFLKENYKETVTRIDGDISFLKENKPEN